MKKVLSMILVLILVSLACSATNNVVSNITDGVIDQIEEAVGEALPGDLLTQVPGLLTQVPEGILTELPGILATVQPEGVQTGSISGLLSYPSEMIPAMMVVATNTMNGNYSYILTVSYQGDFLIDGLAPGTYTVIAYELTAGLPGAYSQMVPCGLLYTCTDHTLIPVTVLPGQNTPDIFPGDWYADQGTFPPMPPQ